MKKILALILALIMCLGISSFAYSVEDAYDEVKEEHSEFIEAIEGQGVTRSLLIDYFTDVCDYMKQMHKSSKITKSNFEEKAIIALSRISSQSKYAKIQDALLILYPDAVEQAATKGTVHSDFIPIVDTVEKLVFDNNMLESSSSGDDSGSGSIGGGTGSDKPIEKKEIVKIKILEETVEAGSDYALPEKLTAITSDDKEIEVSVKWNTTLDVSKAGTYKAEGVITLPSGYVFTKDMTNAVVYTVKATDSYVGKMAFSDVPLEHWAYEAVGYLSDNLVISGYLDGTFKPNKNITRAEFAKIIVSAMNTVDFEAKAEFNDVSDEDWFAPYVASAYKNGYITGYPDGSFRPNDNISRADICAVIYRCIKNTALENSSNTVFADDSSIPNYAREGVYALAGSGIVNGMGDNRFAPLENATRAQASKIIYLALFNK